MSALQLNPHPKALFLIHHGNKILPRDKQNPASNFFKCLLISRQFLRASQMYRVYQIIFYEYLDNQKFNLNFIIYCGGNGTKLFQLTLEEIRRLNQLLNAQYIDVFEYRYTHADKYSALCKIFKGQIALSPLFDERENEVHKIINQIKDQLYSLRCKARSLLDSPEVPRLDLIYCALFEITNFYQLKQALINHRIRKMAIENTYRHSDPRFNEAIDDSYFVDFPICPRIKKLNFGWDQLDETHEIVSKLSKMVPFFPNLTDMRCDFGAERYTSEQFTLQKLVVWITKECRKIEELKKTCPSNTTIKLLYEFKIHKLESIKTVKQVTKEILKKTKFNQLNCFEHVFEKHKYWTAFDKLYYGVDVVWNEPNFYSNVRFTVDLDPQTSDKNEVVEDGDNLLIPRFSRYALS